MSHLRRINGRYTRYAVIAALTAGALAAVAPEALASGHGDGHGRGPGGRPAFSEVDLVSDQAGRAPLTDPDVVNAWGMTFGPTTPLWVNDNATGVSTLYAGGVGGAAVTKVLRVPIPNGTPTGQTFNGTPDFVVTGSGGTGPSAFIFVNQNGDLSAWNPQLTPGPAITQTHVDGAVFTGLARWDTPLGHFLLATDFRNGRIDVFDHAFQRLSLPSTFFTDRHVPAGFAPFDVMTAGDTVYVAYARHDASGSNPVTGRELGFVDAFTDFGQHVRRVASGHALNAPWGLAIAPASFGPFAGDLLVGNFGDGRINVFSTRSGRFQGPLTDTHRRPLVIDGLRGLLPGTATTGGVDAVWFSAGPQGGQHGLVGQIRPAG
ncbi:MAG TPA: TIGR03118 family protein [Mycobacteriales bacterium]|nr:TIGR03118 family protein [Mycobacteriales bacterium]